MSLYEGTKSRVRVGSGLWEEFPVKVGVHRCYYWLSQLLFAIVVNVATEDAREGLMKKSLYSDHLVLTSETMKKLWENYLRERERYLTWKIQNDNKRVRRRNTKR